MTKPFTRTFRVPWSDLSASGHVALAGYFHYVIETAWDWGAENGLSSAESEKLGFAWVIRETELNIKRPLFPNDRFELTIWLYKWRRVRGTRFFELRLKDTHEIVAQGAQQIVALDAKTMRPVQPPQDLIDNFILKNAPVFQQGKIPKVLVQENKAFFTQRVVEWRDLDTLEHVNNAVYVDYAEGALALALDAVGWSPEQFKAHQLQSVYPRVQIKYLSSAVWGDKLEVVTSLVAITATGGVWHIAIENALHGEPILTCIIEWSVTDRRSGEEQILPESLFNALNSRVTNFDEKAN